MGFPLITCNIEPSTKYCVDDSCLLLLASTVISLYSRFLCLAGETNDSSENISKDCKENSVPIKSDESPSMVKCPWCNDMFNSAESLKFHKSTQHSNRNSEETKADHAPQKCPYCAKGFRGSSGLQHHMKVNEGYISVSVFCHPTYSSITEIISCLNRAQKVMLAKMVQMVEFPGQIVMTKPI